jgi:hypothetical protein
MSGRASIFENDDEIDVSGFAPKPAGDRPAPPAPAELRAVAEAAKFRSREAPPSPPAPPKATRRRRRTGRDVQVNIKASRETVDAFFAIADRQRWVLGETLEHAVAALTRQLAEEGRGGGS